MKIIVILRFGNFYLPDFFKSESADMKVYILLLSRFYFAVEIKVCNVGDDWWCTKNSNVFKLYVPMQIIFVFFDSFFLSARISSRSFLLTFTGCSLFRPRIQDVGQNLLCHPESGITEEVRQEYEKFMPESDKHWVDFITSTKYTLSRHDVWYF